jgi:hypothetical protein
MGVVSTVVGVVLIAVGLNDMFHSLMHPGGKGSISHAVLSTVWRLSRVLGHRFGTAVGPAGMMAVVVLWVVLQGVGWALVYLPHVPGGFTYSPGVDPAWYPDIVEALYISLVTLATLGLGDVVPTDPWIRLASPLQALTGFALLTAALTWFTQIYPPLSRRRALALELKALADADYAEALPGLDPAVACATLASLTGAINRASVDLGQHAESYFFQDQDPNQSLARQLPYAVALRDAAASCAAAELQAGAGLLSRALEQLAGQLRESLDADGDPGAVFDAYAADHHRRPRT